MAAILDLSLAILDLSLAILDLSLAILDLSLAVILHKHTRAKVHLLMVILERRSVLLSLKVTQRLRVILLSLKPLAVILEHHRLLLDLLRHQLHLFLTTCYQSIRSRLRN